MSCGMCGPATAPAKVWQLTDNDGRTSTYLTKTEALVASTAAGGGTIERVANEDH